MNFINQKMHRNGCIRFPPVDHPWPKPYPDPYPPRPRPYPYDLI